MRPTHEYTPNAVEYAESDATYDDLLQRTDEVDRSYGRLVEMGLVETELQEIEVEGPHRLLILDESVQPGGAYKYYGAAYAVSRSTADRVVSGTAGNFGSCMGEAAQRVGKRAAAFVPDGGSDYKVGLMTDSGVEVVRYGKTVVESIQAAEDFADANDDTEALHPYNNPDSVAALMLMAGRITDGLFKLDAAGQLNLQTDRIQAVMQRGGGSGLAALAAKFAEKRAHGQFGDNVSLYEARPDRNPGGSLNMMFDGLAVEEPGSYVAPLLADRRYVQGTLPTCEEAVADGARLVYEATGKYFEPSALAGLGAVIEQMRATEEPTVFVVVLSGRNMTDARRDYFMGLPGLEEDFAPVHVVADVASSYGHAALSGATAIYKEYRAEPNRPESFVPYESDNEGYYTQLEELGIVLAAASRQHAFTR